MSTLTDSLARPVSGKHTHASTACDVSLMVNCLIKYRIFKKQPGREHATYPSFPSLTFFKMWTWLPSVV